VFYPSTRQHCRFEGTYKSSTRQITRQKPSADPSGADFGALNKGDVELDRIGQPNIQPEFSKMRWHGPCNSEIGLQDLHLQ
jgi:hypothetical protein